MSTITIPMPDDDLEFLRAYSKEQGISPEAFLARQAHNLRMQLAKPLHPAVSAASGIMREEVSAEEAYRAALEAKHA